LLLALLLAAVLTSLGVAEHPVERLWRNVHVWPGRRISPRAAIRAENLEKIRECLCPLRTVERVYSDHIEQRPINNGC
jgi:hypothetical protein